jgi:hypothetical protein
VVTRFSDDIHPGRLRDEAFAMWAAARAEANLAYDEWCEQRGHTAYAIYRAAEDRADAAEFAYAQACASRHTELVAA